MKKLDPLHDLPFALSNHSSIKHHEPSIAEQTSDLHVVTKAREAMFNVKLDAIKDAVMRRAPVIEIEEIQAQARMVDNSDRAEAAIQKAFWEARRESQGMLVGLWPS